MPFGGAGPLHAAALARELGISRVLCPRASGVLCALGLAAAAPRRDVARTVMLDARGSLSPSASRASARALIAEAARGARRARRARARAPRAALPRPVLRAGRRARSSTPARRAGRDGARPGCAARGVRARARAALRLPRRARREVELVNIRVSVWGAAPRCARARRARAARGADDRARSCSTASRSPTSVLRGELAPGSAARGPALCALPEATLLIPPGWSGEVDEHGHDPACATPSDS